MSISFLDLFPRNNQVVDFSELVLVQGSGGVNPLLRFFKKVSFTDSCWIWTGATNRSYKSDSNRYGRFRLSSNPSVIVYVHRFIYAFVKGPIPDDMEIHHTCFNTLCVNPNHLQAVTIEFNHGFHRDSNDDSNADSIPF